MTTDVYTTGEPCDECGNDVFACPRPGKAVCVECGETYDDTTDS